MPQNLPTLAMVQAFVAPKDEEVVDNEEDLEERILAIYLTVPDEDSDDDGILVQPASIPHHQALAALETLTLYGLQSGPFSETAEQFYYRKRRRIEAAQPDKRKGKQTIITASFILSGADPGPPVR
ncbi:hypothetical protein BGX38DRAFT_1273101 [Terfezia claveryi]|nr:hypothetical protein BGX38DRAFT_1273101 [Terfezia claveryi]